MRNRESFHNIPRVQELRTLWSANPLHKRLTVETTYARYGQSTHVVVTALLPPVFVLEGKVQGHHLADRTHPIVENP
jgi:hypothetical protein